MALPGLRVKVLRENSPHSFSSHLITVSAVPVAASGRLVSFVNVCGRLNRIGINMFIVGLSVIIKDKAGIYDIWQVIEIYVHRTLQG